MVEIFMNKKKFVLIVTMIFLVTGCLKKGTSISTQNLMLMAKGTGEYKFTEKEYVWLQKQCKNQQYIEQSKEVKIKSQEMIEKINDLTMKMKNSDIKVFIEDPSKLKPIDQNDFVYQTVDYQILAKCVLSKAHNK